MRPTLLLAAALLGALAPRALDAAAPQPPVAKASVAEEAVAGGYPRRLLTRDQALADIALMRRGLETIHPGLYRYRRKAEIDAAFARLQAAAAGPISDLQLWGAVALMLAEIHCDHTKPEMSDALERYRNTHPTHLPLRFAFVEGRMIVVSNDAQPGAPPPGSEITAVNDIPVPRIVASLGRAVAYDGATVDAIAAKLSADSDLMGDDFNEYWPAFYGFPDRWRLAFEAPGDARLTRATLAPISFKTWAALPWPGGAYRDEFYKALTWRVAGKEAYLRLDTFVNYRNPVDADAFLDGFFKILAKDHVDRLILDLRNNSGGSDDVSVALGRYLLPSAFTWLKPVLLKAVRYGDLADHMDTWGDRAALFDPPMDQFRHTADGWWERRPRLGDEDDESALPQAISPDRFAGRVTVLTGPRNGSGATMTIAQLKDKIGARLVGEDTSGSAEGPTAGHIFLLTVPNSGLKVRIPNAWNRATISTFTPERGVAADEVAIITRLDVDAGVDAALDLARGGEAAAPPPLRDVLAGRWSGALDYRDFTTDQRVILPTGLQAEGAGESASLAFTYDDGPGKVVHSTETWRLSDDRLTLRVDGDAFHVIERRGGKAAGDLTLVADGKGEENGHPVDVRMVLTRRGDRLSAARLTRRPGEPYLLRHACTLHAVAG
jgi:hypothetical protein